MTVRSALRELAKAVPKASGKLLRKPNLPLTPRHRGHQETSPSRTARTASSDLQ